MRHYRCPSHVVVTHLILGKLHQCVTTVVPRMWSLLILFLESCTSVCHYRCPSHVFVTHLILGKLHQCVSLPLSLACVRYSSYSWKAALVCVTTVVPRMCSLLILFLESCTSVCHYRCPSHVFVTHLILGKLHQCVSLPLSLACVRYSSYSWKAAPVCVTTVVPRMCSLLILFLESCTSVCHYRCPSHVVVTHLILRKLHQCATTVVPRMCSLLILFLESCTSVCHYRCPSHVFVTHLILRKLHQCVTTVVPRMCSLLILFLESCTSVCHYRCPSHVVVTHLILRKLHQCATTVVPRMWSLLILFLESCTSVSLPLSLACVRYSSYS